MSPLSAVTTSTYNVRDRVSAEEWEVRVKLAAAYRLAALLRWTDHIYTHFSVRVPGPHEHFLINAFGLLFDEITASNLVKVDVDGAIIDDPLGLGINQAGYVIHSAIHRARPDLKAVLHTHTRDGAAVSAQRDGLLPISQHALAYYSRVVYHDYEGVALDLDEQARLVANLGDSNILILRNHGLLTGGVSVEHCMGWSVPATSRSPPRPGATTNCYMPQRRRLPRCMSSPNGFPMVRGKASSGIGMR